MYATIYNPRYAVQQIRRHPYAAATGAVVPYAAWALRNPDQVLPYVRGAGKYANALYGILKSKFKQNRPVVNSTVTAPIRRRRLRRGRPLRIRGRGKQKQLVRRVRELSQKMAQGEGWLTYRTAAVGALLASNNVQNFASLGINDLAITETILGQLRYYDPSTPGTLLVADFTSGTFQRKVHIDRIVAMLTLRNNYQTQAKVTVYTCKALNDTSISPTSAYVNGMNDSGNDTAGTNPLSYITDSPQFKELWKIVKKNVFVMSPGDEVIVSSNPKGYWYDASLADSHNLTYQREFNSHAYAIFVQGVLSHDSAVANEQGLAQCGIDYNLQRTFQVKYDAGVNIQYTYVSNNYDTPTNGFVQSQRPISDNVSYSVA